ncbi:MAG: YicC/YloC family endoribonuclease [Clostridia bacterium]
MLRSMTGCGRGYAVDNGRELTIELKSVNHRYLDINIKLPRVLNFAEDMIRKNIPIARGHVDVFLQYSNCREDSVAIVLDEAIAMQYANAAKLLSEKIGVKNDLTASILLKMDDVVSLKETDEDEGTILLMIMSALSEAVAALIAMRENEGERIKKDLCEKVDILVNIKDKIAKKAPDVPNEYKKKLTERLFRLTNGIEIEDSRLFTEIALFTDKASIDEELVRIDSHIFELRALLFSDGSAGRKLDFLLQELNREFNTIGSKANSAGIASLVIDAKAELEKLREQAQNIE